MNPQFIDDLAKRLAAVLPPGITELQHDLEHNLQAILRARLAKLDLVTRDEFDAQTRVLARSRSRLAELEKRLAELEEAMSHAK
ncbi:MAG: accessory factor UbiK family protein [Thiohalomonadaceae bacterium]